MSPKIQFCDNKSLVSREGHVYQTAPMNLSQTLKADYDIQMQIMEMIRTLDIEIPTLHVKGHQNDHKEMHKLSYKAKLNIKADMLATKARQKHKKGHNFIHYPAAQCSLTLYLPKTLRRALLNSHLTP
jgi:hypothetical protein